MIFELLAQARRRKRYERYAELLAPIITAESQRRLDATLSDARSKAIATGKTPEEVAGQFGQAVIDRANDLLSRENAVRIRQWTEAILDAENKSLGL